MSPSWYDLLDVAPDATVEEVRAAWKDRIAGLDPTDRRFRTANQAAEVLLDPQQRAAYDAELAAQPDDEPDLPTDLQPDRPEGRATVDAPPRSATKPAPKPITAPIRANSPTCWSWPVVNSPPRAPTAESLSWISTLSGPSLSSAACGRVR